MHSELRDPISAFYMICAAIFIIELYKNSPIIGRIDDASTCYDSSPVQAGSPIDCIIPPYRAC